jgi:hypothetical protein
VSNFLVIVLNTVRYCACSIDIPFPVQVVRLMVTLVVVFAMAWIPVHSFFVASSTGSSVREWHWTPIIYLIAYWMSMSTSAINPCLYFGHSKRFRASLRILLRCCPFIRSTEQLDSGGNPMLQHRSTNNTVIRTCSSGASSVTPKRISDTNNRYNALPIIRENMAPDSKMLDVVTCLS